MKLYCLQVRRWLHSPVLHVALLGIASWLLYLRLAVSYPLQTFVAKYPLTDFGRANGWSQLTLLDFVLTILAAFDLYLLAWFIVRRHPRDKRLFWLVIAFAALFALTLLAMYPITATDIFEYVFHSRILTTYGQNPLTTPPITFKSDPYIKTVNWAVQPSPYGPLWVILTVPGSLFVADDLTLDLYLMKALPVLFYLGCVLVIAAILKHKDANQKIAGTLIFAWNPLTLFEAPGNGHNGIIMMFFALLAVYCLVRGRWVWVLPALVASVLVKYVTAILLLPFLIYCLHAQVGWRNRLIFLFKTGAISALIAGILAFPFLAVPAGLLYEADFYSLLAVPTLGFQFLRTIHGDKIAKSIMLAVSSGAYLLVYALSLRYQARARRPLDLILLSTWLTLAYLVIGSMHFQPWFAIWPIALGIWTSHAFTRHILLAFTVSALFSYVANFFWIWNIRTLQNPQVNLMFVLVIFAPPVIIGILSWLWSKACAWQKSQSSIMPERA
ncbi:MAG: hypothetical protein HY782_21125 [Chloroflexi bacterium]|nr:hypothetical protein [Chloroflexota bacterium]